jgi:hypothetical protein
MESGLDDEFVPGANSSGLPLYFLNDAYIYEDPDQGAGNPSLGNNERQQGVEDS